jgi:hypothetical protein
MRYIRRYNSPNGSGAHTRTDSKMSAHYVTHKQRLCVKLLPFPRGIAHANPPTRFPLTHNIACRVARWSPVPNYVNHSHLWHNEGVPTQLVIINIQQSSGYTGTRQSGSPYHVPSRPTGTGTCLPHVPDAAMPVRTGKGCICRIMPCTGTGTGTCLEQIIYAVSYHLPDCTCTELGGFAAFIYTRESEPMTHDLYRRSSAAACTARQTTSLTRSRMER